LAGLVFPPGAVASWELRVIDEEFLMYQELV